MHCFDYGRGRQQQLNKYCETVNYYERLQGLKGFSFTLPYIVASRRNEQLLNNLLKDDYPVLMEGIHCTFLLNDDRFASRKLFVRLHNVEHIYYRNLFRTSASVFRKLYYWWEARLLYKYEKRVANKALFWAVSEKDVSDYKEMGCTKIKFLPLFLPVWKVDCPEGIGTFCLYHGNLSVAENEKAAIWLVQKVFNNLRVPLVLAGKNPGKKLRALIDGKANISLEANPDEQRMKELVSRAQIHVLPSFNKTGIKLKLINALFNGRHCLVNEAAVDGSRLEPACHTATTAAAFKSVILQLINQPFGAEEIQLRRRLLGDMFNNGVNAKRMVQWIWGKE